MGILDAPALPAGKNAQEIVRTQDAAALLNFRAALANRGAQPFNILAVGDSQIEGVGVAAIEARWINLVLSALRQRFQPSGIAGGIGYVPAYFNHGAPFPSAGTVTGSPTQETRGMGSRSLLLSGTQTWTRTVQGTAIDIFYTVGASAGNMSVSIDGGAATTINTNNTNTISGQKTRVSLGSRGSHTVTISVGSASVYFEGIMVYDQDETLGIRLWEAGRSGATVNTVNMGSGPSMSTSQWRLHCRAARPSLLIVNFGANDLNANYTKAFFKQKLKDIIATAENACADEGIQKPTIVITMLPRRVATGQTYPWSDYREAMYEVAAESVNAIVFDLAARTQTSMTPDPLSLFDGNAHAVAKGHVLEADLFVQRLLGA